jgi:hypothetical protein
MKIETFSHKPIPLGSILDDRIRFCIDYFLWYGPIDKKSIQSETNLESLLLSEKDLKLSKKIFEMLMNELGMKAEQDEVEFYVEEIIPKEKELNIRDGICINCQQLILQKYKNESRSYSLLRHLRNSIAHGRFIIVNDMFIGEDRDKNKQTAFLKLKIENFYKAIKSIYASKLSYEQILMRLRDSHFKETENKSVTRLRHGTYGYEVELEKTIYRFYFANKFEWDDYELDNNYLGLQSISKEDFSTPESYEIFRKPYYNFVKRDLDFMCDPWPDLLRLNYRMLKRTEEGRIELSENNICSIKDYYNYIATDKSYIHQENEFKKCNVPITLSNWEVENKREDFEKTSMDFEYPYKDWDTEFDVLFIVSDIPKIILEEMIKNLGEYGIKIKPILLDNFFNYIKNRNQDFRKLFLK